MISTKVLLKIAGSRSSVLDIARELNAYDAAHAYPEDEVLFPEIDVGNYTDVDEASPRIVLE